MVGDGQRIEAMCSGGFAGDMQVRRVFILCLRRRLSLSPFRNSRLSTSDVEFAQGHLEKCISWDLQIADDEHWHDLVRTHHTLTRMIPCLPVCSEVRHQTHCKRDPRACVVGLIFYITRVNFADAVTVLAEKSGRTKFYMISCVNHPWGSRIL